MLIERDAGEGHVTFPTDEAAHGTPRRGGDGKIVAICVAPDDALGTGGLELAVHFVGARGLKDDVAVVEGAAELVSFGKAETNVGAGGLGGCSETLELGAADDERGVAVAEPVLTPGLGTLAHAKAEVHTYGVAGDEELGEDDEVGVMGRGL